MHRKLISSLCSFCWAGALACGAAPDGGGELEPVAPILSSDELDAHLQSDTDSPLDQLSEPARERFVDSLVFGDNGLGSYRYDDLEAELSVTQIHDVLRLFGVENTAPLLVGARVETELDKALLLRRPPSADYEDMYCESRGTCSSRLFSICTSNC
jgi:hypothetical protein